MTSGGAAVDDGRTQASAVLPARPDTVLAVVADLARYPEWVSGTTEAEVLQAGGPGRPERARFRVAGGPLRGSWTLDYRWDVRPDGTGTVAWSLVEGDVLRSLEGSHELRAVLGGTRVTSRLLLETRVPLLAALRRRAERFLVERVLSDLRDRVTGAPGSTTASTTGSTTASTTGPVRPGGPPDPSSTPGGSAP